VASTWHAIRPGTDTAVMSAWPMWCLTENLADTDFLDRYTIGWDRLARYVTGETDGAKTPEWAESISAVPAEPSGIWPSDGAGPNPAHGQLVHAAGRAGAARVDGIALASLLGQIGLPGGDSAMVQVHGDVRVAEVVGPLPRSRRGRNPIRTYIPVARITDLLNRSAETLEFNGDVLELPDTRLSSTGRAATCSTITRTCSGSSVRFSDLTRSSSTSVLDRDGTSRRHRPAGHHLARARRLGGRNDGYVIDASSARSYESSP
jgi:biotin/methionine sulfoxide reductase